MAGKPVQKLVPRAPGNGTHIDPLEKPAVHQLRVSAGLRDITYKLKRSKTSCTETIFARMITGSRA